jgi:hypothetical protein
MRACMQTGGRRPHQTHLERGGAHARELALAVRRLLGCHDELRVGAASTACSAAQNAVKPMRQRRHSASAAHGVLALAALAAQQPRRRHRGCRQRRSGRHLLRLSHWRAARATPAVRCAIQSRRGCSAAESVRSTAVCADWRPALTLKPQRRPHLDLALDLGERVLPPLHLGLHALVLVGQPRLLLRANVRQNRSIDRSRRVPRRALLPAH